MVPLWYHITIMPPKIAKLKKKLLAAGFASKQGKGSHVNYYHDELPYLITLPGKNGQDAKKYEISKVNKALEQLGDL